MDKKDILAPILSFCKDKVKFAMVFGSFRTGRITDESDLDLGLYLPTLNRDFKKYFELKQNLNMICQREIDLVVLNDCDIIICMQILANGELFINNNPGLFVRYKTLKISEYIDFKIDRKNIENNMLNGRIYA